MNDKNIIEKVIIEDTLKRICKLYIDSDDVKCKIDLIYIISNLIRICDLTIYSYDIVCPDDIITITEKYSFNNNFNIVHSKDMITLETIRKYDVIAKKVISILDCTNLGD